MVELSAAVEELEAGAKCAARDERRLKADDMVSERGVYNFKVKAMPVCDFQRIYEIGKISTKDLRQGRYLQMSKVWPVCPPAWCANHAERIRD